MPLDSALTVVAREGNIASFPAIRAIVKAIGAELHIDLPFANRAILFAIALAFRPVTLNANDWTLHGSLQENCT
jgi:hypothetical protein